jgi:hypothetical protein
LKSKVVYQHGIAGMSTSDPYSLDISTLGFHHFNSNIYPRLG